MTFVQIGVFDWLSGRQKGSIFVKMFKNLLLRNHMEDEAETWLSCLGYYPLQKLCFIPSQTVFVGGYTVFTMSVLPCVRVCVRNVLFP